jgi:S1-C subfamily serine protease
LLFSIELSIAATPDRVPDLDRDRYPVIRRAIPSPSVRWCRASIGTILLAISMEEKIMSDNVQDALTSLSDALAERVRLARPLVVGIVAPGHRMRSGTLWRKDVVVASEQTFPDIAEAQVALADGSTTTARLAGRDPGTNIIAFRLDGSPEPAPPPPTEPHPGALALALGADESGVSVRLGVIHAVGPTWHSRAGGRIDRRITLDIGINRGEEGGPVLDAGGGLLGISTLGPRRRVLVIPSATVEGVLDSLLSKGRVERGWLGLALQPVLVPEALQAEAGQTRGLMVMGVSKDGPAAQTEVQVGDILVAIGGDSVTSPAMVAQRLGPQSVGQAIELRLLRSGKPLLLQVTVGVRPSR